MAELGLDFLSALIRIVFEIVMLGDAYLGLQAARKAVFSGVPWQRYQSLNDFQQNASQNVPRLSMKREVAADIRAIFNALDRARAEVQLRKTVEKYAHSASKLTDWMEGNIPEGLTVSSFPGDHWRQIRTVNSLERVCQEIRRRTRVAVIFPNNASCMRLVSALLMEISESWETGKIYLSLERF